MQTEAHSGKHVINYVTVVDSGVVNGDHRHYPKYFWPCFSISKNKKNIYKTCGFWGTKIL